MRCLTPKEVEELFGPAGFRVSSNRALHRTALRLEPNTDAGQIRIGARFTPHILLLVRFAEALNRWFPPNRHRLLWVDHAAWAFPSTYDTFLAARVGVGETRSLIEAPGHYFDPYPYDIRDQTEISPEQARETGILIGFMLLIMINEWDGWLIADDSSDRIEFWEGNLFIHSHQRSRIAEANLLLDEFDCPRDLV